MSHSEIPDLHPPSSRRHGIMLAMPFDERRLARWEPPYIVQPKLDGERCRAILTSAGVAVLLSSEANIITSVPHINAALERTGLRGVELDGELYTHGLCFEELIGRTKRTVNEHEGAGEVEYHIFDIATTDTQAERTLQLAALSLSHPLHRVPHLLCSTLDEIMRASERFIAAGFEGCVVRHTLAPYERKRSLYLMKWKPRKDDYYEIVGAVEECDKDCRPKGRLGALVLRGGDGALFNCGTGFDAAARSTLWEQRATLPGRLAHVKYQHLSTGRGVPRFPVFVELVDPMRGV